MNLFDSSQIVTGYEVYGDGSIQSQADSTVSAHIPVRGLSMITISGLQANTGFDRYYVFLAGNKSSVVGTGTIAAANNGKTITVPSGASWFRFSPKQRNSAAVSYATAQVEAGSFATAYEPFATVDRYGLFGDSITETCDVANGDTTSHAVRENWPLWLLSHLNPTSAHNYAKAGARFAAGSGISGFQILQAQIEQAHTDGRVFDRIIVSAGTNDWGNQTGAGITLGSYAGTMAKVIGDLSTTISADAMRKALWSIKTYWPDATCWFVTPLQRSDSDPDSMNGWVETQRQLARRYGFTIIDGFTESGIVYDFASHDLSDGLHPNASGQGKQGRLIVRGLR